MPNLDNPEGRLLSFSAQASKTQKRLIDFITANPTRAPSLAINELAREAKVSETTVVRLARMIGYAGFKDFKAALIENRGLLRGAQIFVSDVPEEIAADESLSSIAKKVIHINAEALCETEELLDEKALQAAIGAIEKAVHVHLIGFGSSSPVALDAYQRFQRLGISATYNCDPHVVTVLAATATRKDVFFCVSYSGESRDVIEAMRTAGEGGAFCIVLTSFPRSTAARAADCALVNAFQRQKLPSETVASRVAQLAIIDALCAILTIRGSRRILPASKRIESALEQKRYKAKAWGKEATR